MKTVYEYLDYRQYLHDFYESSRGHKRHFSLRFLAGRVGVDTSNLHKILSGRRHLPDENIPAVIRTCGLDAPASAYFRALVRYGKARTRAQAAERFEKLLAFKKVPSNTLRKSQYEFYRRWYYTAMRALLASVEFDGSDYVLLARRLRPAITPGQAREAVHLLQRLELIRRDDRGVFVLTGRNITTGEAWHSEAIREYQEESIRLSSRALSLHDKQHRDISTVTMGIDARRLEEVRELIANCRKAIIALVDGMESADTVYQLNIQFFPVTGPGEGKP